MKKVDRSEMKAFIQQNPGASTKELMKRFKLKNAVTVYQVKNSMKTSGMLGKNGKNGKAIPQSNGTISTPLTPVISTKVTMGDLDVEMNHQGLRTIVNGAPGKVVPWATFNELTH